MKMLNISTVQNAENRSLNVDLRIQRFIDKEGEVKLPKNLEPDEFAKHFAKLSNEYDFSFTTANAGKIVLQSQGSEKDFIDAQVKYKRAELLRNGYNISTKKVAEMDTFLEGNYRDSISVAVNAAKSRLLTVHKTPKRVASAIGTIQDESVPAVAEIAA